MSLHNSFYFGHTIIVIRKIKKNEQQVAQKRRQVCKNIADAIFLHQLFALEYKQIALMAEEKSPA